MKNRSKYLKVALEAASAAEEILLRYFHQKIKVNYKKDHTPVSLADRQTEKVIIKVISRYFPEHDFLGEEEGQKGRGSGFQWIIDPIDGTKNFLRGLPMFATQIALMKKGEVILGVSNAPALGELIYAEKGKGAYCNHQKVYVSEVKEILDSYVSFGGLKYFVQKKYIAGLLALTKETQAYRSFGDFWQYHLLAQGKIDIVVEADVKIWDIAALKVIGEEAGARMTDMEGRRVGRKTNTILAANKFLHPSALKYFSKK